MINAFRRLLIRAGKVLPFMVCFLVCFCYAESLYALITDDYLLYDDVVILNAKTSFFIGSYFEYNLQMLVVLCIVSIAIQTCFYNKLACLYLGVNLLEKSYFDFELYPEYIYAICIVNILICGFFCYKGLRIISRKQ